MKEKYKGSILLVIILSMNFTCIAQAKWPIPFLYDGYNVYHKFTNDVKIGDTTIIQYSRSIFFKIVLLDTKGKSYFEAYQNQYLIERGYYENSIDTLKKYVITTGGLQDKKIQVMKYFQPLKNGIWIESIKGKKSKIEYDMGIKKIKSSLD